MAARELNTVQKPFVMPVSHTTPDNFGLGDRDHNRQQAQRLLTAPYEMLHEDDYVILGISTQAALIEIFIYKKAEAALTYYLRSEIAELDQLGIAATKVALWRRAGPGLVGGTSRIIFYLLDKYGAVVSHEAQTYDGRRYWIDRMAEAWERGWTVGVTEVDTLLQFDGKRSLLDWVHALGERRGKDMIPPNCFYISKTKITRIAGRI